MQAHTSKTGCRGCHCDLEQHMWLNYVFVCEFCQDIIRSAGRFYFVGSPLFCDKLQTHLGALLLGRVLLIGTLWYMWYTGIIQWNLYKATTELGGLSRQVVFHDRENKHDFVKTVTGYAKIKWFCKTFLDSLDKLDWLYGEVDSVTKV